METKAKTAMIANWAKQHLKKSVRLGNRECNLCSKLYFTNNKFSRFCRFCRMESELYRLAEWLPTAEVGGFTPH